jgi:hypothetical protein
MNDEEYYKCFRVPKQDIDRAIDRLVADTALIISQTIMQAVTMEVGDNPDRLKTIWYYRELSMATAKRLTDKLIALVDEASRFSTETAKKDIANSRTGIG